MERRPGRRVAEEKAARVAAQLLLTAVLRPRDLQIVGKRSASALVDPELASVLVRPERVETTSQLLRERRLARGLGPYERDLADQSRVDTGIEPRAMAVDVLADRRTADRNRARLLDDDVLGCDEVCEALVFRLARKDAIERPRNASCAA